MWIPPRCVCNCHTLHKVRPLRWRTVCWMRSGLRTPRSLLSQPLRRSRSASRNSTPSPSPARALSCRHHAVRRADSRGQSASPRSPASTCSRRDPEQRLPRTSLDGTCGRVRSSRKAIYSAAWTRRYGLNHSESSQVLRPNRTTDVRTSKFSVDGCKRREIVVTGVENLWCRCCLYTYLAAGVLITEYREALSPQFCERVRGTGQGAKRTRSFLYRESSAKVSQADQSNERHLMPLLPFGPDGVRELTPSGTWDEQNIAQKKATDDPDPCRRGNRSVASVGRGPCVLQLGATASSPLAE